MTTFRYRRFLYRVVLPVLIVLQPLQMKLGLAEPSRALSHTPDCGRKAACRCPWKNVLTVNDFATLDESLVPKGVARCPRQDECEWQLFNDDSGLAVYHSRSDFRRDELPIERHIGVKGPFSDPGGTRYVSEVDDGWIVALNVGEFGAALWWVARDGSHYKKLGEPHVVELIKIKAGILAPTGFDHNSYGKGEVLLITRGNDKAWRVQPLATLDASAYAATSASDDAILVVTRTQLVKVTLAGIVTVLHNGRWGGHFDCGNDVESLFYPGSIVTRVSGDMFIGMRAVVVHLIPAAQGYKEEWLGPRMCITDGKLNESE